MRDLFLNLTRAQLTARYKTTALGFLWFLVSPLVLMVALTIVFQHVIRLDIPDFPLFALAGLLPWTFFAAAVASATTSLPRSSTLIKRAQLPRSLIPLAEVAASLIHFVVSLGIFIVIATAIGRPPPMLALLLPVILAVHIVCVVAFSLLLSSLEVIYRDVEFFVAMALRVLFYVTPLFYPLGFVPEQWRPLYLLNPMVGIIDAYHAALVRSTPFDPVPLAVSAALSVAWLAVGVTVFRRLQPRFDDHV